MDVCKSIDEIREVVKSLKSQGKKIGFVPTMGALHEGHLSLIRQAKEKSDEVVVSIFVNPEQFGPNEDFESYPREMEEDLKKCEDEGVTVVFAPNRDDIYDEKKYIRIEVDELNRHMCGGSRPGCVEEILLIVNKLF